MKEVNDEKRIIEVELSNINRKLNTIYSRLLDIQEQMSYFRDEKRKQELKYEQDKIDDEKMSIEHRKNNFYEYRRDMLNDFERGF